MSINKAQGQSLQRFGVYLPKPVFSHGQLYVALSRATNPENIKILILDSKKKNEQYTNLTKNVVYKNILFWPSWRAHPPSNLTFGLQ